MITNNNKLNNSLPLQSDGIVVANQLHSITLPTDLLITDRTSPLPLSNVTQINSINNTNTNNLVNLSINNSSYSLVNNTNFTNSIYDSFGNNTRLTSSSPRSARHLSYEFNEEQETCLQLFDKWSPVEQIEFAENLLRRMCHFQHGHINNFLKPMLQRDFISSLPGKF